jgi:bacillithiol biosynthesis cysteine-adding enzyme BshC
MDTFCIDFDKTNRFENIFLDYINQQDKLKPFYGLFPNLENFEEQVLAKSRQFSAEQRKTLHAALTKQYLKNGKKPQLALDLLLKENTFTLTTGHQLNIFTGPLYFHYKIMTVIKAAQLLREKYPQYNFVPVYWMASEDHDADEISYFKLFGKKYTWNAMQTGSVGRFKPHSLLNVIDQVPEMHSLFTQTYKNSETLADATRLIVNELYGSEGLIVIDGDDENLKQSFQPIVEKELLQESSFQAMQKTSQELENLGYKIQVNGREINLFYLDNGLRERIVKETENGKVVYKVLNTNLQFTEKEIIELSKKSPEKFSPNVVLRPVYQELILPNVSYTGGPGELAYWLQLKNVFANFGVLFPILLQRNHVLYLTKQDQAEFAEKNIEIENVFLSPDNLKKLYISKILQNPQNIDNEIVAIQKSLQNIANTLKNVDNSLESYAIARSKEIENITEHIAKKLQKTQENKFDTAIKQLHKLQDKLCPNGGLQERSENFLTFYLNNENFLQEIMQNLNPFDRRMVIVKE